MSQEMHLLDLPDFVLYHICHHISSPFDLLNLGCTCKKFHQMTTEESLWWNMSVKWFHGMWNCPQTMPDSGNSREWFLEFLRLVSVDPLYKGIHCQFDGDEVWTRLESLSFRCLLKMSQLSYEFVYDDSIGNKLRYDMGLFIRKNPTVNFKERDSFLSMHVVQQLTHADFLPKEKSCSDVMTLSRDRWIKFVLPLVTSSSPYPNFCPTSHHERAPRFYKMKELADVVMYLTIVLEKYVIPQIRNGSRSINEVSQKIRKAVRMFIHLLVQDFLGNSLKYYRNLLVSVIKDTIINDNFITAYQHCLDTLGIRAQSSEVLQKLHDLVKLYYAEQNIIENIRGRWLSFLYTEIERVLYCKSCDGQEVTFINFNPMCENELQCVITEKGVFVKWIEDDAVQLEVLWA